MGRDGRDWAKHEVLSGLEWKLILLGRHELQSRKLGESDDAWSKSVISGK